MPTHLLEARQWERLSTVFADIEYLRARIASAEAASSIGPEATVFGLILDLHRAIAELPQGDLAVEALKAVVRVLQADAYLLKADPGLLPQQLYNSLVWDWDESTLLGRTLRDFERAVPPRPWLKRRTRPHRTRGPLLAVFTGHRDDISSLAFSPDGRLLASGSRDGTSRVWDVSTGAQRLVLPHGLRVTAVTFTPDGSALISASSDGTVRSWALDSGESRWVFECGAEVAVIALAPPNARWVAAAHDEGKIVVFDTLTAKICWKTDLDSRVYGLAFSANGQLLAAVCGDGARFWDADIGHLSNIDISGTWPVALAFDPESDSLLVARVEGGVELCEPRKGRIQKDIYFDKEKSFWESAVLQPRQGLLLSGGWDGALTLWDMHSKRATWRFFAHEDRVEAVALATHGGTAASAGRDSLVKLWDLHDQSPTDTRLRDHEISAAVVAPEANLAITVDAEDGRVFLWDADSARRRSTVSFPTTTATAVACSRDGRYAAAGALGGAVRVWTLRGDRPRLRLKAEHKQSISALAFSPDGRILATADEDGVVKVWALVTFRCKNDL